VVRRLLTEKDLLGLVDKVAVEWHHNSYWVFGMPGGQEPDSAERLRVHLKYKGLYEELMALAGDEKSKFSDWA